MKCENCDSKNIVKDGQRKLIHSTNQRYRCTNCGKKFSAKRKFSNSLILSALRTYNSGKSLAKTSELIRKDYKTTVTPMTISRWTKKYSPSFQQRRKEFLEKYNSIPAISSKNFFHSGVIYPFMLHEWKLREFCRYEGLRKYLDNLNDWINKYFSSGKRCSQIKSVTNVKVFKKKNMLCSAAELALSACSDLKERHALVQKHLLFNDVATIATEVPVWLWDKQMGAICGHIDILQVRFGRVWVVDFKPGAESEDKLKVASQLFWYSRALSFRSKIPLSKFRCAWFDSQVCYEFEPGKASTKLH